MLRVIVPGSRSTSLFMQRTQSHRLRYPRQVHIYQIRISIANTLETGAKFQFEILERGLTELIPADGMDFCDAA